MAHMKTVEMPGGGYSTTAKGADSKEMKVDSIDVEVADNGGYIVTCRKSYTNPRPSDDSPSWIEPEKLAFEGFDQVYAYMAEAFGEEHGDMDGDDS